MFQIKINYPPTEEEKADIKRINNEDIFPGNIAVPDLEENEICEHGNKFSPELTPLNIESRNVHVHHSSDTKDSSKGTLLCYFLKTEGDDCDCKKHFTGEYHKKFARYRHHLCIGEESFEHANVLSEKINFSVLGGPGGMFLNSSHARV